MGWDLSPTSRGDRVLSASERPKRTVVPGSRRLALRVAALRLRGISPTRTLLEIGVRKTLARLPGFGKGDVTWV
jgi:hypothetical protein